MLHTILAQVKARAPWIILALAVALTSGLALANSGLFADSSAPLPPDLSQNPAFLPEAQAVIAQVSPAEAAVSSRVDLTTAASMTNTAVQDAPLQDALLFNETAAGAQDLETQLPTVVTSEVTSPSVPPLPAVHPPPVQIFHVPMPEDQIRAALFAIHGSTTSTQVRTYISIAPAVDNTLIYYDHWEDGFEADIANPASGGTSQIWGDGDASNGIPPGFTLDVISAGDVIVLENTVNLSTRATVIDFDGGDKIGSSKTIALTRAAWATIPGTVLAGAVEVNDEGHWGTDFTLPVGQNINPTGRLFRYVGALIMAGKDGTALDIDMNGDGTDDVSVTIDEGASYLINGNLNSNATVVASKPVQLNLITGNIGQTETRWYALAPVAQWGDSYYSPVDRVAGQLADAYLFNPDSSDLTVEVETSAGAGLPVTVAAGGTARVSLPEDTGTHFFTTDGRRFYGLVAVDQVANDWGFSLIAESALTSQVLVGWGAGRDPTSTLAPDENASPVWITVQSSALTDVCVDYNGDGGPLTDPNGQGYDALLQVGDLDNALVYDPDGDQTAMILYVCDGSGARLAAAWGQDPEMASSGPPALDLGTAVPPLPAFAAGKGVAVIDDADGDGSPSPGDTFAYSIVIHNITSASLPGVVISDALPLHTSYVASSTAFSDGSSSKPIADAGSTPFPLDEGGVSLGELPGNGVFTVTFLVVVDDLLPAGVDSIFNQATIITRQGLALAQVDTALNFEPAVAIAKSVYLGQDGGASCPGSELVTDLEGTAVTYCFEVTNTGDTYLDQIALDDMDLGITEAGMTFAGGVMPVAPGDTALYYYEATIDDDLINTVQATANPSDASGVDLPGLDDVTASDTAEVAEIPTAMVFGRIFEDSDGSGLQDAGEPGLLGIDVIITDGLGTMWLVTTDANGDYAATLAAGIITADVDESSLPVGAVQTAGIDPSTVTAQQDRKTNLGADGYQLRATVSGRIFEDKDGDGNQDLVEPGIPGVSIYIIDRLGVTQITTSDANGDYLADVPAGQITADVDEDSLPTGAVQTAGTDPTTVNAPPGINTDLGTDGYQLKAIVFGLIFEDNDGDGILEPGEPGIPGVQVVISDRSGVTRIVATNANGDYRADVPAGSITADVDENSLPPGAVQTAGIDPTTVMAPPGSDTDLGADGYQMRASVFGRVFEDRDGSGAQELSESGLPGVKVKIVDRLGTTQIATTDVDGDYSAEVPAGSITVDVDESSLPPGAVQTAGTDPTTIDVPPGSNTDMGADGYRVTGSVVGTIYIDENQDGALSPGADTPLVGVDVIITDSAGLIYTVTTDGGGTYSQLVIAGQTTIDVDDATLPGGLVLAPGSSDPTFVDVPTGGTVTVNVGYIAGAIGDSLWFDMDGNGKREATEIGIPNAVVTLTGPAGETRQTVTADDGSYLFEGLPAGTYVVLVDLFTLPAGAVPTFDLDGILDNLTTIDLAPGENNLDADFGYRLIGGQGCTPGYWKQPHHFDSWTDFHPAEGYNDVFGVTASFDLPLLEALRQGGGQENALGRHAVAALLNATSRSVTYLYSRWHIVLIVQAAYASGDFESAKDLLEAQNQQGCPLN